MPYHEYVEDVLQEIHLDDMNEIEMIDKSSYFTNVGNTYRYAKDRAFGSSNTYTAVYLNKNICCLYYSIISKQSYPYNSIIRQELGHCLL